jgi:hypothetical protein
LDAIGHRNGQEGGHEREDTPKAHTGHELQSADRCGVTVKGEPDSRVNGYNDKNRGCGNYSSRDDEK